MRRAFTMRLKPGALEDYVREHDNVWPELVAEIERSGIASITTFQSGDTLFLVSEIFDAQAWDKLWHSDIHREWGKVMEPLMHLTDDGIVDAGELTEIFHLTTGAGPAREKGAAASRRAVARKKPADKPKKSGKKPAKAPAKASSKTSGKRKR